MKTWPDDSICWGIKYPWKFENSQKKLKKLLKLETIIILEITAKLKIRINLLWYKLFNRDEKKKKINKTLNCGLWLLWTLLRLRVLFIFFSQKKDPKYKCMYTCPVYTCNSYL